MFSSARFLIFAGLAATLAECQNSSLIAPAFQGVPIAASNAIDFNGSSTNSASIASTAHEIDQKSGATKDTPPNQPVSNITVTAIDGVLVNDTLSSAVSSKSSRRSLSDSHLRRRGYYDLMFWGNGFGNPDAAIQGTAYLTYTLVNNNSYNEYDCFDYCDSVEQCVFVNLYYEHWNPLLDFVFSEKSNLKCVLYADIHNASEKTYFGGQQLYPPPGPLNWIENSGGWALGSFLAPPNPPGYLQVFGPSNGANNASGYMGFALLSKFDVPACATLCNEREADPVGGACQYFNIWRTLLDGEPATYTCSMYYTPTDESTAVYYGEGDLQVSDSYGFQRIDFIVDGSFEAYTCGSDAGEVPFCFTNTNYYWYVPEAYANGRLDAALFDYAPYARTGHSVALLGSPYNADSYPGILQPDAVLRTEAGLTYNLQFYHSSVYSGPENEASASMEVVWNGNTVATINPGYQDWTLAQVTVVAQGVDVLQFTGGSSPAWIFIDDVSLFQM